MAGQRKLTKERKELISQLQTTYQPEDAGDKHHKDEPPARINCGQLSMRTLSDVQNAVM